MANLASSQEGKTAIALHRLARSRGQETLAWLPLEPKADGAAGSDLVRRSVQELLLAALTTSNLLVLLGAGASLCVTPEHGTKDAKSPPSAKRLWDLAEAANSGLFKRVKDAVAPQLQEGEIEALLSRAKNFLDLYSPVGAQAGPPANNYSDIEKFVTDTEKLISASVDFVGEKTALPTHEEFLRKLARRPVRKPRAKIYTTNYDLCIETAAQRRRFVLIDGFSQGRDPQFDPVFYGYDLVRREAGNEAPDFIENVVHLYKLHGSIDWKRLDGGGVVRASAPVERPALIYPRSSKYQEAFETPYLDLMGSFQSSLRTPDTCLLAIGFGFRDEHLSRPILSALAANPTLRIIIVDPSFISGLVADEGDSVFSYSRDRLPTEHHKRLAQLMEGGDERVDFFASTFAAVTQLLPDLMMETEREQHAKRAALLRQGGSA